MLEIAKAYLDEKGLKYFETDESITVVGFSSLRPYNIEISEGGNALNLVTFLMEFPPAQTMKDKLINEVINLERPPDMIFRMEDEQVLYAGMEVKSVSDVDEFGKYFVAFFSAAEAAFDRLLTVLFMGTSPD